MVMSTTTLASELTNLTPTDSEATAIGSVATAFTNYFGESQAGAVPCVPIALAGATSAMETALAGMSAEGAGAQKLQEGIVAFWDGVNTAAATIYPGSTAVTPPPGLSGIAAALQPVFTANVTGDLSLEDAADTVAAALHPLQLGGIATFPAPVGPQPIT